MSDVGQQIDFAGLVLGFSSAALYYMGENPGGDEAPVEKNLELAKQNIDIIDLLKTKTAGNLNDDEDKLITQLVTDLKLKYASHSK